MIATLLYPFVFDQVDCANREVRLSITRTSAGQPLVVRTASSRRWESIYACEKVDSLNLLGTTYSVGLYPVVAVLFLE